MDRGPAKGRGKTLPVDAGALPPFFRSVEPLEDPRVCRGFHQGLGTPNALGMKVQLAHHIQRFDGLSHACHRDYAQQDYATYCHWGTT